MKDKAEIKRQATALKIEAVTRYIGRRISRKQYEARIKTIERAFANVYFCR